MLETLYKYATDNELAAKPGFKHKNVKYYISFSASGDFIDFEPVEEGTPPPLCPDIGENNTQGDKCNFLVVKAEILLNLQTEKSGTYLQKKHDFYLSLIKQAAESDPIFNTVYNGLINNLLQIKTRFLSISSKPKPKKTDLISIKVDNEPLESRLQYRKWWLNYLESIEKQSFKNNIRMRCLVTGELANVTSIIDKINTPLPSSFDPKQVSRAKLICFDKDAFQSYGLEQSFNAPVSKEAIAAVNLALDHLLQTNAHTIAGAKHIYWYSEEVSTDIIELPFCEFDFGSDSMETEDERKEQDKQRIDKMFKAVTSGKSQPIKPKCKYYMLSLSAAKTRIMIRNYDEGLYDSLWQSIKTWFDDICIDIPNYGKSWCSLYKFQTRLLNRNSFNETIKEKAERMNKELSGIAPRIVYAIYHGTQLPDTVAVKALAYIRSEMHDSGDDGSNKTLIPDKTACQILKAWLNRKYRYDKKEDSIIMDRLDQDRRDAAYQTGRLMAVFAMIQNAALGDVGAGVVERYYTTACSSPALVMGKLATMSQYHLSKIKGDKPGLYTYFNKMLEEITVKIGKTLPKTFDLEQQSEFALGYYFQRSQSISNKKTEE